MKKLAVKNRIILILKSFRFGELDNCMKGELMGPRCTKALMDELSNRGKRKGSASNDELENLPINRI